MKLSIIIVNWKTPQLLRDCLASVYAHLAPKSSEVIVVDNASGDGSAEMVATEFPAAILIRNERNLGFAAANNQAMRIARGRYVLLLNSDTVVLNDVFSPCFAYMDAAPSVGVLGCRVLNGDRTVQLTCSRFPTLINLLLLTSGLWKLRRPRFLGRYQMTDWKRDGERDVDVVSGCYMFVRRAAIDEVGLFDEAFFFFGEETDWCRRFRARGWGVRFAPLGPIVHFGGGSAKKLNHRRDLLLTESTIRLHRKHGGRAAAFAAWSILFGFNLSRAAYWTVRRLFSASASVRERRTHFLGIVRGFRNAARWSEVNR